MAINTTEDLSLTNEKVLIHLMEELPDFSIAPNAPDSILIVYQNGNFVVYPKVFDERRYSQINQDLERLILAKKSVSDPQSEKLFYDFLYFLPQNRPRVLACLNFTNGKPCPTEAKISPDKKKIYIYGVIIRNIPSVAVYNITTNGLEIIYRDSVFAVSGCCFYRELFAVLPRMIPGIINFFPLTTPPFLGEHRVLSKLVIAGPSIEIMHHIAQAPVKSFTTWSLVSWSNEECGSIGLWRFDQSKWEVTTMTSNIPLFIEQCSFSPNGKHLLIVLNEEDRKVGRHVFCFWDLKTFEQKNYTLLDVGDILNLNWTNETTIIIYGSNTIHELQISSAVRCWVQQNPLILAMIEIPGNDTPNIIISSDLTAMMTQGHQSSFIANGTFVPDAVPKIFTHAHINYLKASTEGALQEVQGLHLHRCENCSKPLLHPMISSNEDGSIRCCYCSRDCQIEHWAAYVELHSPATFTELDLSFTKKRSTQQAKK